jgi:hypothetical protein
MKWGIPADRLSDDQQLDELLARAVDDWLHPADVFDVARFSGLEDEEGYVEHAIHLVRELLGQGLVVAGDLSDEGFQQWSIGAPESVARIARRWREDHESAPTQFFVWFQGTEAGIDRGRQALGGRR